MNLADASSPRNQIAEIIAAAGTYGLFLNREDVVTAGIPEGWAIIPRHWGYNLYDYTVLSPSCGWSGGSMQSKRRTIKAARKSIALHVGECRHCEAVVLQACPGLLARLRGVS